VSSTIEVDDLLGANQHLETTDDVQFNNLTLTGSLRGPATMTIDPAAVGDNTGTLIIAGNLQVDGTTTTINSTTLTVDDLNLTLASGAASAAAADGAGLTVDGASATILYNATTNEWDFNRDIEVTGRLHTDGGEVLVNTRTGGVGWVTIEPDTATLGQIALNVIDSSNNSYASIRGNGHAFFKTIGNEATNSTNKWYTYTYTDNTYRFNYNGAGADEFIITAPSSTNRTAVYIDSENSSLAIGTTSPTDYGDTKLNLYGDGTVGILGYVYNNAADTQAYLNFGNSTTGLTTNFTSATGGLLVGVDSDETSVFWNYHASALRFGTSGLERMRVHSNGNVHIGADSTTTNISALSIKGTSSNGMVRLLPTVANAESTIGFHTTTTGTTNDFWVAGHGGWGNSGDFTIGWGTGSPDLLIQQNGNVGIGTTSPEEKLHVLGQASFENSGNTNRGNIIIGAHGNGTAKWATLAGTHYNEATGSGNGSGNAGIMIIGSHAQSGSNQVYIGHGPYELNPATHIRLGTHSADTHNLGGTTHMTIDSVGQVGIGTSSPTGRKLVIATDTAGDGGNLLLVNKNDTDGDEASIGFSMVENNTYVKAGIAFERTNTSGRGSLHFALNNSSGGGNVVYGTDDVLKLDADAKNAWFYGNVNVPGDKSLYFHTNVSSAYEARLYLSDYPSQGYTAGGSGYASTLRYWPTLESAGGVFVVVNTDGGANQAENGFDSFVVWQGNVDGKKLFKVSNGGNTSTRRLALNSDGSETTFIPDGSGLDRVDLMVRSYTSGEKHGQVIACDNNGEAHLYMVDTANTSGSASTGSSAGGWGLDVYYDGLSDYPYNLRTGSSGTWTHREKINFNGTREFMNSDLQHNDAGKSVQWTWFTTPAHWYSATTSSVTTNFDVSSGWTNLNGNTLPTNVKAIYVTYYYHIDGYNIGSGGQGDHASDLWGPNTPSNTTSWSFTSSGNVQWGSAFFMHDGDSSETGDMLYFGAWYPGAIIAVNANNNIYSRLSHGYSGGTHYHHMYCWGYAT
jgi:hypothetical protein